MNHIQSPPPRPVVERAAVLVLVRHDGGPRVEIYGDRDRVSAKIVTVPYAGDADESIGLSDAWLDSTLPPRYRRVYWPGRMLTQDTIRVVRPSDVMRQRQDMRLISVCNDIVAAQESATWSDQI